MTISMDIKELLRSNGQEQLENTNSYTQEQLNEKEVKSNDNSIIMDFF